MALTDFLNLDVITTIKNNVKTYLVDTVGKTIFSKDVVKSALLTVLNSAETFLGVTSTKLDDLLLKSIKDGIEINFDDIYDELFVELGFILVPSGSGEPEYAFRD
jgi:hypothetical protein